MVVHFLVNQGDVPHRVLADQVGVSLTELQEQLDALRRQGYPIISTPDGAYRLQEAPDRLTAIELLPLLTTRRLGRHLHTFDVCESTNALACDLAQGGAAHGTTVIAEAQTRGRGRRGRTWHATAGRGLAMSVVLRPPVAAKHAAELTLVAGVAVAETIHRAIGKPAELKWPNDVHLHGRKVAGILSEVSADVDRLNYLVVGIGVNINQVESDFPDEVAAVATSLRLASGIDQRRAPFVASLLAELEAWTERWSSGDFRAARDRWRELSSTLGRSVRIRSDGEVLEGHAIDIDDAGALLVRQGDAVRTVNSGDVEELRVRPPLV